MVDDFVGAAAAVAQDVKCCFSDDTLPDGYAVKKGDMVNYQPYQMGRMRFLWGADAEEFRPERWLDDAGVFVPESPFKFTAFQVKSHVRFDPVLCCCCPLVFSVYLMSSCLTVA